MPLLLATLSLSLLLPQAAGFGILLPEITAHLPTAAAFLQDAVVAVPDESSSSLSTSLLLGEDAAFPSLLISSYTQALVAHPLGTKISTGVVLAIGGDGIAQLAQGQGGDKSSSSSDELQYDAKRAAAFCAFDGCYRAVQHVTYPPIIDACRGQFLMGALGLTSANTDPSFFAAMEQTLVSQLVIIPLLYYPVFYAVTGFVQGLTQEQTLTRAKETFVPLMKRNLLFWIPVQFLVFGFVEGDMQIPVLTLCGLIWTMILSAYAGSVASNTTTDAADSVLESAVAVGDQCVVEEEVYCITGMEDECLIDPDDLFRPPITINCPDEDKKFIER